MIVSFGDKVTEDFFHRRPTSSAKRIPRDIVESARRKLDAINAAHRLLDLASPPGNRLETLQGRLADFHSIRINSQWRIIFRWVGESAHDVSIVDYHKG